MDKVITLLSAVLLTLSVTAGDITVADGSATHASLPVCSYYFDTDFHGQILYDKAELTGAANGTISSITFYSSTASQAWGAGTVSVKLAEVSETALSALLSPEFTEVYAGTCSIAGGELTFTLATPFAYSGEKNLLVDIQMTKKGTASYSDVWFYGQEVTGTGYSTRDKQGTYTYTSAVINFRPKTTFAYSGGAVSACEAPSKLKGTATPDGGQFTWEGEADTRYQWCAVEKDAAAEGWALLDANVFTYTATGLTTGKAYDFYVRTYCSESLQSEAKKVSFTPVCNTPALRLTELGTTTASFEWERTTGISKYQFACVLSGATPDWSSVTAKETNSVTVDTLLANTAYDFYVRSYFSESVQSAAAKLGFKTDCAVKALPMREQFLNTTLPDCWAFANQTGYGWQMYGEYDITGTYCVRFNAKGFIGSTDTLCLPAVNLSEPAVMKMVALNTSGLEVKLIISTDGGATFEEVADLSAVVDEVKNIEIDLAAYHGEVNLYFTGKATGAWKYFYMDNIQVVATPCNTPKELKAEVSSDGAVLTWEKGGAESAWNIRYKAVSASEWTTRENITEARLVLSGLTAGTEYEAQIQSACSAEKQSSWSSSVRFTPECPVPAALTVLAVTENAALVGWESPESAFNLQYKKAEDGEWTTVENIAAKSYELSHLAAATTYQVQVQAACGSEYSAKTEFTTACAPLEKALPYSQNFEAVEGDMPECWERRTTTEYPVVMLTSGARGATEDAKAKCLVFLGDNEQLVILPAFDKALSGLTLSFYYHVSASAVTLQVGYLTSLYSEFTPLETLDNELYAYADKAHETDLKKAPAEAKYVAFRYSATSAYVSALIDDLQLRESEEMTALPATEAATKATKRILNGQLVIEHNGVRYNAQGTMVQ